MFKISHKKINCGRGGYPVSKDAKVGVSGDKSGPSLLNVHKTC
jgi:hypothetical protein